MCKIFLVKSASTFFQNVAFWNNFSHFPSSPHPLSLPPPPSLQKKKKRKGTTVISMRRHFMFKYMN